MKVYNDKKNSEGSFGKVYKGKYQGGQVAVKEIEIKKDKTRKSLTEREIEENKKLDHENVLKLFRFTSEDKYMYDKLIMIIYFLCNKNNYH